MQTIAIKLVRQKGCEDFDKPSKEEKPTLFKICTHGCPNCDTKRTFGCCKK